MEIRTAERKDMEALLSIYNYEVLNGVATFDLEPKTMEERMKWFEAHNVENHPLIVAVIEDDIHTVISVITGVNEASIRLHREFGCTHCGTMKQVGKKFGKLLDIDNFQLMV